MKTLKPPFLFVLLTTWNFFIAIYDAADDNFSRDITNARENGCKWHGGSTGQLVCNCEEGAEMTIRSQSIPSFSTAQIEINKCRQVTFEENAISDMRNLRAIVLNGIDSISFKPNSINWYGYRDRGADMEERFDVTIPSLRINVFNSSITEISSHAFAGRIKEIVFDGVTIHHIQPIAFANMLQTEKIAIRNSMIKKVDIQAFKTFGTETMEIHRVAADVVPSRTLSNITVYQNFTIDSCSFGDVHSGAFAVFNPKVFQVTNTNVNTLYGEAFKVASRGTVLFRNNTFGVVNDGAFQGITLRREEVPGEALFVFDSNTFTTLYRYSLNIPDFIVKFRNIYLNETCDCTNIDHKIKDSAYFEDIMCLHDNQYMTLNYFKSNLCSVITNYYITIIIVCIVVGLLILSLGALLIYYRFVYRSKKYGSKERNKNSGNLSLIVPDGRTYRETELHVIVEKTDLLTTDL